MENVDDLFYYDEYVDVIDKAGYFSKNAVIESIRGTNIIVKYVKTGESENIDLTDNIIIKQCKFKFIYSKREAREKV